MQRGECPECTDGSSVALPHGAEGGFDPFTAYQDVDWENYFGYLHGGEANTEDQVGACPALRLLLRSVSHVPHVAVPPTACGWLPGLLRLYCAGTRVLCVCVSVESGAVLARTPSARSDCATAACP